MKSLNKTVNENNPGPVPGNEECPANLGPGQNINQKQNKIYDLDRIRDLFGQAGPNNYSCRTDIPTPYVLDPLPGSRPYEDRTLYENFMRNFYDYSYRLSTITDTYLRQTTNTEPVALCALEWLYAYASTDLLTEPAGSYQTPQGDIERMVAIAGLTMAYARIEDDPILNFEPIKKSAVEDWLQRASTQVMAFSLTQENNFTNGKNNLLYWSGFSLLSNGLLFNDAAKIDRALQIFEVALDQITNDGYLPLELERGASSFWYHQFALRPLVFMAEIAMPFGINLYSLQNGRMHLLVNRVIGAYLNFSNWPDSNMQNSSSNPGFFLTDNTKQLDWAEIYYSRFGKNELKPLLQTARAVMGSKLKSSRQTGGNSTLAYGVKCL